MDGGVGLDRREATFSGTVDRQKEKRRLRSVSANLLTDVVITRTRTDKKTKEKTTTSGPPGVVWCGKRVSNAFMTDAGSFVGLQKHQDGASLSGVVSCHSVYDCPVCASRIAIGRREEVAGIVSLHQAQGGRVAMVTLTVRHDREKKCGEVKDAVTETWSKVRADKAYKAAEKVAGVQGGCRSLEVTHGEANGWHPHLHVLIFFAPGITDAHVEEFLEKLIGVWLRIAAARGFECERSAQDWRFADTPKAAGDYVTKWGVDWELTHAHLKKGKGGRSPFQILADYAMTREGRDANLFKEYSAAFRGARQLTWFGVIRELFKSPELTDEEVAADDPSEMIGFIDRETFHAVRQRRLEEELLALVANGGRYFGAEGFIGLQHWFNVKHIAAQVRPPEFAARFRRPNRRKSDG